MTERTRASWLVYVLGALCAGAIVAAILLVGPASSSTATITRTATAAQGIVQSTVSGSGNLQAASQLNLGFKTSGTVTRIYISQGQHVTQGQLIATLDPQSAEVTLEQAKASLQSAEANLAKEQETDGEGTSTGGSSASRGADASAASITPTSTSPTGTTPPRSTPTSTTPTNTATTPAATTPATTMPGKRTSSTTSTGKGTKTARGSETSDSSSAAGSKSSISTATREANLASAKAAVRSDTLTVQSDQQAVQDTKLYAPQSGTIVSLSGQVGEVVSGSGTTKDSSTGSSSSGSTAATTGAASTGRSATNSSASSGSGSSSSSSFAVLSDLSSMQLVVALSESEIDSVKDGQIATVTVEALNASKLAAHVSEVALLSTSSSGAVSYDVTFHLDQLAPGLKLGMSATAEVVVKQAQGVNVPTTAISAGEVTVQRNGKQVRQRVVTGLAGNTSTIVLSGLKAGETVVLPAASTTGSSATNVFSKISSRLAGGGLGAAGGLGGAGGAGAGGGGAFFRGGG
jgi:multidrug efflux pump subunit AcrA (membrane-fusion protein)